MINHFESFGSLTIRDVLNMVNHMSNYYLQNGTDEKHSQALDLLEYMSNFENTYITSLPIEVLQSEGLVEHLPVLIQVLEDFYGLRDEQLQRIRQQMQEARFILEYVNKAVKTHGKIQACKASSVVGKGQR